VVDHVLTRRSALADLRSGRVSALEACDASPYLQRAAAVYGEQTDRRCPVCARQALREVLWVYGEAVGDADGTARTAAQVAALALERPDFTVYRIEVCPGCGWNHLLQTWRTGTPGTPAARRSRRSVTDP
jgi:RNA polymerase subunit RPABC4/transcription elongation factor Spt4